ncbi:hypothetical protein [Geminisphaera colitermitum]|uniref:hypothetical protein n=1 Tax=Geminisphaera colitermitum TaxID=1148786 RepID=UPI0001965108|nr:hypothetical protein [Geminisphaera colitermitum]
MIRTSATLLAAIALATNVSAAPPERYTPEPCAGISALVSQSTTPLFTADFAAPAAAWIAPASHRGSTLPQGWHDFTTDPKTEVRYSRLVDDGLPMLHMVAGRASTGSEAAAVGINLGDIPAGTAVKISLTLRSPTRTPARLLLTTPDADKPRWQKTINGNTGWQTLDYNWRPTALVTDVRLALALERPGTLDVSALTIETIRVEELKNLLASTPAFAALGTQPNALRHTRFPLGLPTGWAYAPTTADGEDLTAETDPATPGPTGAPALKLTTHADRDTEAALVGEHFTLPRFWLRHTFSLSIKGNASGSLKIASGFDTLATKKFTVTEAGGWQRLTLYFNPRALTDSYFVQLALTGEAWIDGLRVAPTGDDATSAATSANYVPSAPAELALASPAPARVTFAGDSGDAASRRIDWTVLSDPSAPLPSGAVLRAKIVNLYEQQIRLPDTPLPPPPLSGKTSHAGSWTLPEFPSKPFGAHRVEAWIEDTSTGARIGAPDEIIIYRLPRPRHLDTDAPDSPFGTHVYPSHRHLAMAKAAGINWARLHDGGTVTFTGWYFAEKERGQWAFYDRPLQRYRDHHIMILGQLGTAPAWASALQRIGPRSWTDRYYQPEDLDAWQNYVRTVTAHYRGKIRDWEIWNEPWLSGFWKKGLRTDSAGSTVNDAGDTAPEDFAKLTQRTVAAVRAVDPSLTLVGLNTTAGGHSTKGRNFAGDDWTRRYAAAGGTDGLSAVSYHQYAYENAGYPDDSIERGFKTAVGPISDAATGRPAVPVWMTEGSVVQGHTGPGFYYRTLPFAPSVEERGEAASDRLLRYMTALLAAGDAKIFLYAMHKHGRFDNGNKYRVLLGEDGYLHPTAVAHAALAWRIEGKPFSRIVELTPNTRAYVFYNDNAWAAVLIPRPGKGTAEAAPSTVSLRAPGALEIADLFGNPILPGSPAPNRVFFVSGTGAFTEAALVPLKP